MLCQSWPFVCACVLVYYGVVIVLRRHLRQHEPHVGFVFTIRRQMHIRTLSVSPASYPVLVIQLSLETSLASSSTF